MRRVDLFQNVAIEGTVERRPENARRRYSGRHEERLYDVRGVGVQRPVAILWEISDVGVWDEVTWGNNEVFNSMVFS